MKQTNSFVISEFTNPSGEVVFRVSGWLDDKRVRKNCPTLAEAKAEADALEIRRLQGETAKRPAITRLTEEELQEAEVVMRRLAGNQRQRNPLGCRAAQTSSFVGLGSAIGNVTISGRSVRALSNFKPKITTPSASKLLGSVVFVTRRCFLPSDCKHPWLREISLESRGGIEQRNSCP